MGIGADLAGSNLRAQSAQLRVLRDVARPEEAGLLLDTWKAVPLRGTVRHVGRHGGHWPGEDVKLTCKI